MGRKDFSQILEGADNFTMRRAVERLREGLFDPFGVRLLTARESQLDEVFDTGVQKLAKNESTHLCICGSYGQGKSHSLAYLRQRALAQGFVTSLVNVDPREIRFQDFRQVYNALVSRISFPNSDSSLVKWWKDWAKGQKTGWKNNGSGPLDVIPETMPHYFKAVLAALAQDNIMLSKRQKGMKKHASFRPREFSWLLANAMNGNQLPVFRLRHALKYRQVSFYKDESLVCKGWEPYFEAVTALGAMFRTMGFKGWALLFDEGESIAQLPVNTRRKSYSILHRFFVPASPLLGIYPIFAFTDDFFMRVKSEDYGRVCVKNDRELPYFEENYAVVWRHLNIHSLHNLSAEEWKTLAEKLIRLHARAYDWMPPRTEIRAKMVKILAETGEREARLKIKSLINILDLTNQRDCLSNVF
ncbi:MAG: hypothetical protein GXP53_13900 [Deltaproteobacteria bacterium]|nr:hypothetical protein [Deltaproteobacteria bacterium]